MKYVRTKDKIYEICENGETYNGFGCKTKEGVIKIHKKDIVKQADTIEELCDEFVVKSLVDKPIVIHKQYMDLKDYKFIDNGYTIHIDSESEIYGAIWTDKGLIYVAKMNDKGVLELL